jgi:hypothetical protein
MRPAGGLSPVQHSEQQILEWSDVRFGSKADMNRSNRDVRFYAESGHPPKPNAQRAVTRENERDGSARLIRILQLVHRIFWLCQSEDGH